MFKTLSTLAFAAVALASAAQAEIISISSMGFNRFLPNGGVEATATNGTLEPDGPTVFHAAVQFPVSGRRVCSLALVYQDGNAAQAVSATLLRKPIVIGSDALSAAQTMAVVSSADFANTMQRAKTAAVQLRKIDNKKFFYFLRIAAQNFNTMPVGVQIDVRSVCP